MAQERKAPGLSLPDRRATGTLARRVSLAAAILLSWTAPAASQDAGPTAPIKIAVFPFELEDFTAAAEQGSSLDETSYLAQSTEETERHLLESGRYEVVDTSDADLSAATGGLRNCRGCEAAIAQELGADQALIGVVTKITMMEYVVDVRVSDAGTGGVVATYTTNLRMGAHDSWFRGVRWLMQNRVLAQE